MLTVRLHQVYNCCISGQQSKCIFICCEHAPCALYLCTCTKNESNLPKNWPRCSKSPPAKDAFQPTCMILHAVSNPLQEGASDLFAVQKLVCFSEGPLLEVLLHKLLLFFLEGFLFMKVYAKQRIRK